MGPFHIMGDSLEATEASEAENVTIVEFNAFTNFITKAATVLLPEDNQWELAHLRAALDDNQEVILKFLSDPQVSTLYIQRNPSKGK